MRNLYLSPRGLVLSVLILTLSPAFSQQSVSIGTTTIDNDAVLFLLGDGTQGLIIPKTTDMTAMPKKAGMVVYNESDGQVYSCDGNTWKVLGGGSTSDTPVLQINGNNLSIFTGVNVSLATTPPTNKGQLLMWDGTKWTSTSASDPTTGSVLAWNGARWEASANIVTNVTGTAPVSVAVSTTTRDISIATGGITNTLLADNSVTTAKITDGTITASDLSSMSATSGQVLTFNGTVWAPATSSAGLSSTLNSGNIFVGNASNVATGVTMSGDATMTNAGVLTIGTGAITSTKILDGTIVAADLNAMSATNGQVLQYNGSAWVPASVSGTGDMLKSVYDANNDNIVDVAASVNLGSQTANTFLAAPNGSAGTPTFRSMAAADLPNIDVSKLTTGTLGIARGGTGLGTTPTNGQLLIGNGTGYTLASLTAGTGISVTPGAGSITIASTTSGTVTSVSAGTGLTGGPITTSGTLAVNVGTGANQIPQLDGTGKLSTSVLPSAVDANTSDDVTTSTSAGGDLTGTYPNPTIGTGKVTSTHIQDGTIAADDLNSMSAITGQVLTYNGTNWTPATSSGLSTTLTSANIFVGNGSNVATGVAMSGDATISNTGAVTIANNAITSAKISDGTITSADITDGTIAAADLNSMSAITGQVLTYNGTNWAPATSTGLLSTLASANIFVGNSSNVATGVAMSGDATISNTGALTITNNAITSAKISDGTVTSADITDGTIAADDLNAMSATNGQVLKFNGTNWLPAADNVGGGAVPTLSNGQILIGDGTNNSAAALSGDATLNAGVLTISADAIGSNEILDGSINDKDLNSMGATSGQILTYNGTTWAPSSPTWLSTTLTSGNIYVGNSSNTATSVAMSGDATLSNAGVLTVSNNAIGSNEITNASIAAADLANSSVSGGTGGVVTDASITSADLAAGSVSGGSGGVITDGSIVAADLGSMGATTSQVLAYNGSSWGPAAALSTTLTSGNIYVGNSSNVATGVAMSGDGTLSNAGVLTLSAGSVSGGSSGDIVDASITSADLANGSVAGGTGGVITDASITSADIADGTITTTDLASGAVTASNGLTATSNNITLGGTLSSATSIAMGANNLTFTGTGNFVFQAGNVGLGASPANKLDVEGGAAIGATYSGTTAAPTNGLIVEGNVGIGNSSPGTTSLAVGTGTANETGLKVDNAYSGANTKTGLSLSVSDTGTGAKTGISNAVNGTSGSASTVYGLNNSIVPNGSGSVVGLYNTISSAGTGARYGFLNSVGAGSSSTSSIIGSYDFLSSSGSGTQYGGIIYVNASGTGKKYGSYLNLYGTSGSASNIYGTYNSMNGNGTGDAFGTFNFLKSVGTGNRYGTYDSVLATSSNTAAIYALYAYSDHAGSGASYGVRVDSNKPSGSSGTVYGMYNQTQNDGSGTTYGIYVDANKTSGVAGILYGVYITSDNDGTSNSYVLRGNSVGSTTATEYGVYITGEDFNYFSGKVGIGTTSSTRALNVAGDIDASGGIYLGSAEYFQDGGANEIMTNADFRPNTNGTYSIGTSSYRWSTIYATNGTISTSDQRLKKDINDLRYGLKDLMKLRPVSFRWKEKPDNLKLGLIAQEVQRVLPEVVDQPKEGYMGILYSDIVPVTIKAIQEQQAIIEKQQAEIEILKAKVAEFDLFKSELLKLKELVGAEARKTNK